MMRRADVTVFVRDDVEKKTKTDDEATVRLVPRER